jgi:hypothetical protein
MINQLTHQASLAHNDDLRREAIRSRRARALDTGRSKRPARRTTLDRVRLLVARITPEYR